jgi:hypothetical protein
MNVREVLNVIFYVLWTGCQWKALAKGPAAAQHGVWEYIDLWDWDGMLDRSPRTPFPPPRRGTPNVAGARACARWGTPNVAGARACARFCRS